MKTKKVISTKTRTEARASSPSPSPSSSSMEKTRKCFLCARQFQSTESKRNSRLSITESSFMLNEIFELPPGDLTQDEYMLRLKFQNVCYCSQCLKMILNVSVLASELEILKEELEREKVNVVTKLKESFEKVSGKKGALVGKLQELRREIVEEIDKSRRENENSLQSREDLTKTPHMISKDSLLKPYPYKRKRTESIPSKPKSGSDDLPTSNSILHHLEADTDKDDTVADMKTKKLKSSAGENCDVPVAVINEVTVTVDPMLNSDIKESSPNPEEDLSSVKKKPKLKLTVKSTTESRGKKIIGAKLKRVRNRNTPFYQPKECEECGKILSTAGTLKDHIVTVHRQDGRHKCELCDHNAQSPAALKSHMMSRHSDAKNFTCDKCDKSFKRIDQLQAHLKTYENRDVISKKKKKSKISKKVPAVFPPDNAEALVPNQRKTTRDSTPKSPYYQSRMCQECGKVLSNLAKWRDHILTIHRGQGKYRCELCDYTCQFPSKLKIHMDSQHSDTKKFKCDLCQKSFNRKDVLNSHKKLHEGNTPFECKFCSARFLHSSSLKKHVINRVCSKLKSDVETDD